MGALDLINKDVVEFASTFKLKKELEGSRFLITGATGLIGSTLVRCLIGLNNGIRITCPVRNIEKTHDIFGKSTSEVNFIECDLINYLQTMHDDFEYIVHCASPTNGKYMTEHPVETYEIAVETTRLLLNYASVHKKTGMIYVSSLEYYGQNFDDSLITEGYVGYVDYTQARSSYQVGKRSAEYLCRAYSLEYGVNVKVARLTQTFGAGISKNDNRVFAQFARSVIASEDIVLHTKGESAKPYCYTTDCVAGILYILLKGECGEAYNVANEDTYISIKDMAEMFRENYNQKINVRIELHPEMGYAPVTRLRLSSEKLTNLGWKPNYNLKEMLDKLIQSMG